MSKIRARAPLRVSYAGGGTDVPPYPSLKGGVVLSSTIQNYAYCSITPRPDGMVSVSREDQDVSTGPERLTELKGSGEVEFVRAVAKRFGVEQGFDADLRYDALPGTGLGSSSALCVALIGAFREWKGTSMKELTLQMKDSLLTGNLTEFARLLNSEWVTKKALDSAISTDEVDILLHAARESGAIGGKLLGAGGGGFLFLYCEPGKQVHVEKAVERLGGKAFPVRFDLEGLQTWRSPK